MSYRNPAVSNHDVIPTFSPVGFPDVFGDSNARFAVGQIAKSVLGQMPRNGYERGTKALANFPGVAMDGFSEMIHQYGMLRANVYIDQTRMLPEEVRNSRHEEWDLDDARSDHFVTIERLNADDPLVRDVTQRGGIIPDDKGFVFRLPNCMRMIKKSQQHPKELPIEIFFPDASNPLTGDPSFPAPLGSIELSRKIAVHEEPLTGIAMSNPMFKTTVTHVLENGFGPTLATVEEFYKRVFQRSGMPMFEIAEPRYVGEYAEDNLGIEIVYKELAEKLGVVAVLSEAQTTQPFTLYGTVPSLETAA